MGQIFSWSADGRYLAFQQWGGRLGETMRVRVLDTTAPGTSLTTAKVLVAFPYSRGTLATMNTFLTPDGTRIAYEVTGLTNPDALESDRTGNC